MCRYIHDPIFVIIFTRKLYSPGFSGHCLQWPWPLISKVIQHIYEPKYLCDKNWVKFPSSGCEIWRSQGFWVIACCDLDIWPFDLISMSQAQVHMWPNFGEINSNNYEGIVFTLYSGSLPAVALTFDPRS